MTKITEASTMTDLGISPEDVGKLYKRSYMAVDHDLEFEQISTKSQARSKMKNGYFLVAINDGTGDVAMVYSKSKRFGAGSYYSVTTPSGETTVSSIQDVVANLPGKGWKYYASMERYSPVRQGEKRSEEEARKDVDWKTRDATIQRLERVHGPKLKKEAKQYADEMRNHLIAFIDSDTDKNAERKYRMRGDEYNGPHMHYLRKAFKELQEVVNSDRPFETISPFINAGSGVLRTVQKHLKDAPDRNYHGRNVTDEAELYLRNAKLASAKVAQLYFKLLRDYRDKVIDAHGSDKLGNRKKATLGKVKKAWESYKADGSIKKL